jgi:hypothetical protein
VKFGLGAVGGLIWWCWRPWLRFLWPFPLRDHVARSQPRWLECQWAASLADDSGRITAEQRLNTHSLVAEEGAVEHALAGLYSEQQLRFKALDDRLPRAVVVDHGLSLLRAKMGARDRRAVPLAQVAAWHAQPSQTSAPPPGADNQTAADTVEIDHALNAERTRWGERQAAPTSQAVAYSAATAALACLAPWFDRWTGAVLLAAVGNNVVRLDVDAGKLVATGVPGLLQGYPTPRQGYLGYSSGGGRSAPTGQVPLACWPPETQGSPAPMPAQSGLGIFRRRPSPRSTVRARSTSQPASTCVDRTLASTAKMTDPGSPAVVAFSPDGRTLAVAGAQAGPVGNAVLAGTTLSGCNCSTSQPAKSAIHLSISWRSDERHRLDV